MKKKSITTVVSFILDESGSMQSIADSVITGFNEYAQGLKAQKGEMLFSLTKFDSDHITMPYVMEPIARIEPLTNGSYTPGSSTPLYDAVVETIEKLVEKTNDTQAIIVAIMTDGYENASRKHDQKCLQELIKKLQAKGNWTFVFMGANQDSWAVAQGMGISRGNTMDWQATHKGTASILRSAGQSTAFYAQEVSMRSSLNDSLMDLGEAPVALNTANFFAGSKDTSVEKKKKEVIK